METMVLARTDAIGDGFKRSHHPSNKGKPLKKGMRVDCNICSSLHLIYYLLNLVGSEDEIRFNLRLAVHSECAVLEHLIRHPTAMCRIGLSEPSCIAIIFTAASAPLFSALRILIHCSRPHRGARQTIA